MRRRSQPKSGAAGVSLFPFLAVLLCTMGALIVVLVVIARQARLKIDDETPVANAELKEELETRQADLAWRIEQLRSSRQATLTQLETQRAEFSHLEDHARRLRSQLEELENTRREFEKLASGDRVETDRLKRQIADAETQLAQKKEELQKALRKTGKGGKSYAVVPYHGPNETRRRPIYIECRGDGVIFQPEGLVLTEKDFEGDLGPGNPLASALRAAREHMSRTQMPGEGAPYPLLLIRPDGIVAYEYALAAMSSWGSEYGYELIGQDWPLEYPPPDPQLALAMRQAIGEGRLRQAYLARAAPRLMQAGQHATFRASPTGGLMRDDGMPLNGTPNLGSRSRGIGRPARDRGGVGSGGGSGRDGLARSSAGDQSNGSKKPGGNPYRAALASQGAAGLGATPIGGSGTGGMGALGGSGNGESILGPATRGVGAYNSSRGSGLLGSGDRYAPAGADGETGGQAAGGGSLLGGAGGSAVTPSSNLLASGTGNARAQPTGYGSGNRRGGGANRYGAGASGAPGTGTGQSSGSGRGWGMGAGKVAAAASTTGRSGRAPGSGASDAKSGSGLPGASAADALASASTSDGNPSGAARGAASQSNARQDGTGPGGAAASGGPSSEGPTLGDAASRAVASDRAGGGDSSNGSATGGTASAGDASVAVGGDQARGARSAKSGGGKSASGGKAGGAAGSSTGGATAGGGQQGSGQQGGGSGQPQQPGAVGVPGIPNLTLGQQPQSIADQRGERNWANPAANHSSFPVTRPIKVVCDADHLTMLPEGRSRRGYKVIEFNQTSEEAVRDLVDSVGSRVETWGAAGPGMYWRPELLMEVEPGGEQRFAELKALLADSGLDVKGRPRRGPAIKYPRTKTPN